MEDRWILAIKNLLTKETYTKGFDAVIVCNGHFSKPYIPDIPGMKLFDGRIIHSHDYRSSKPYEEQNVIVIGAGPSGIDIALQLAKDAKQV